MFSSQKSSYEGGKGSGGATTIIAHGVKVEGEFTSQSDVLIEGEVHGTFATSGMLTVGGEARIKADVKASSALVSGIIEGNVIVDKRLDIKSTARIVGDVTAETIMIESGAVLSGRMTVGMKTTSVPAMVESMPSRGRTNGRERATVVGASSA